MGKRGQITIFIIIGILILLLAIGGLIIYNQQQDIPDIKTPEAFEGQVRSFVESCLSQQTLSGVQIQGKQGGYIEIPENIPTLVLEDATLPYWLDKNLQVPSLDNLKQQLNNHILINLDECLQDFEAFKEQGFNITKGEPSLTITMEDQVVVDLDYPLTFQKEGTKKTVQDFSFEIPINMNLIHQIAADLALFQNAYVYLEQHTNSMISLYGAVKHDSLPPIRASRANFDCDFITWNKVEVKNYLQRYKNLEHMISILGVEELPFQDRVIVKRAERLRRFLTQPFFTAEDFASKKGAYVPLEKTLEGCEKILKGEFDDTDLDELYMRGEI